VGAAFVDAVDQGLGVDGRAGGGAHRRVGEDAAPGGEPEAVGAGGGELVDEAVAEQGGLRDGDVLGDVDVLGPQRVGAGGAVGDELHVDAGGLRLGAPVGVVAFQGGADRAVDLGEGEGAGGVPGGVDLGAAL